MKKIKVEFAGGETRMGNDGCNYMLAVTEIDDEEIELYAEVTASEFNCNNEEEFDLNAFDDFSYPILKEKILEQAEENGIKASQLEFAWD